MTQARSSDARVKARKYAGLEDERSRRLFLQHIPSGILIRVDGDSIRNYLARLAWAEEDVRWIDLGPAKHEEAVYQSLNGWQAIRLPLQPMFAPVQE
jgi:hypothetical protein